MDDELVARSLGALSQVHRLKAFRALVVAGKAGLTPGVLSEQLGIDHRTIPIEAAHAALTDLLAPSFGDRPEIGRAHV